jgi:hypothetical protein
MYSRKTHQPMPETFLSADNLLDFVLSITKFLVPSPFQKHIHPEDFLKQSSNLDGDHFIETLIMCSLQ